MRYALLVCVEESRELNEADAERRCGGCRAKDPGRLISAAGRLYWYSSWRRHQAALCSWWASLRPSGARSRYW